VAIRIRAPPKREVGGVLVVLVLCGGRFIMAG
jgi:hypothetical protein